jgi:hypothetical protein
LGDGVSRPICPAGLKARSSGSQSPKYLGWQAWATSAQFEVHLISKKE